MILAFSKVVAKYPNYILKMAGDGVLLNDCENLVTRLGIENNIQFLGVVTPELYKNELQNSLAFVQHSITAWAYKDNSSSMLNGTGSICNKM